MSSGRIAGPQAQVDLALTSQIVGRGVTKLLKKALDYNSVAPDTVQSISVLERLTPLCDSYRRVISSAGASTTKPDSKSTLRWWAESATHVIREVGLGSNYTLEALLHMRAGENVLGLLSCLGPLMGDDKLVDHVGSICSDQSIDNVNTPGRNQIKALKSSLDPFFESLRVPEAMSDWDSMFRSMTLSEQKRSSGIFVPSDLPSLLENIRVLKQEDAATVLNVYGLKAAPWIAFYCRTMLDLNICLVYDVEETATDSVVQKGTDIVEERGKVGIGTVAVLYGCDSYSEAKVFFYLNSSEDATTLNHRGAPKDFIRPFESPASITHKSYPEVLISRMDSLLSPSRPIYHCHDKSFLLSHFPWILSSPIHQPISHFVAAHTMQNILNYTNHLDASRTRKVPDGFLTYFRDALQEIQRRGLAILETLGFCPRDLEFYQKQYHHINPHLNQSVRTGEIPNLPGLVDIDRDIDGGTFNQPVVARYLHPLFWDKLDVLCGDCVTERLKELEREDQKTHRHKHHTPIIPRRKSPPNPDGLFRRVFLCALHQACFGSETYVAEEPPDNRLFYVLQNAIKIASVLAFTNWNDKTDTSTLCAKFYSDEICDPGFLISAKDLLNADPYLSQQPLIHEAIAMTTTLEKSEVLAWPWSQGWIGLQLPGKVVLRHLACAPNVDNPVLKGCLMTFHAGHIDVRDEGYVNIFFEAPDPALDANPSGKKLHHFRFESSQNRSIRPKDEYSIQVQTKFVVKDKMARCSTECVYEAYVMPISPNFIAKAIYEGIVTKACSQPTTTAIGNGENQGFYRDPFNWFRWHPVSPYRESMKVLKKGYT
ncbi:hypothetical protein EJ08DRAFT_665490 [Tothia fuscella]|uniref:Uncharacterized protein n=1 Tax=Tothia fuscella TaxID=1048955 RepID=A0A9P4NH37_9PEZI|nr:hypothetical protein EJ08DRAFT_665490 [Tothia fuscella]